jgi:hypothetical protein
MESSPSSTDSLIRVGDQEFRAPDMATLSRWAEERRIPPDSYVFHPVLQRWLHARDVAELAPVYSAQAREIAALAKNYRQLVVWVGLQILFSAATLGVPLPFGYVLPVTVVAIMFYAYRTAKALGSTSGVLWAIAMLLPIVNLLGLLSLSSRASAVCQANGIEVGLLGPRVP